MGKLSDMVVGKMTLSRYTSAVKFWFNWLSNSNQSFPTSYFLLDNLLCEFIDAMWEEGEGRALIANVLSGMQHFVPVLRYRIPCSWRLYRAWLKHELPARAPPFTWELVKSMSGEALRLNRGDVAIAILIAFEGILRTGELCGLTKGDIDISRCYSSAVLNLGVTKASGRIGSVESATLEDARINKLLAARLLGLSPGDRLLPKGAIEFRVIFKQLLRSLGIEQAGFKPYSLRRGGATHHFRTHNSLSRTVVKGRWTNARTARVYINEGLAVLASFSFESSERKLRESALFFEKCTQET